MTEREKTQDLVRRLFDAQRYTVLSTQSGTGPYCSLVAFWAANDLSHTLFATMRETRKFANLAAQPRVAMLFDDRSNQESDVERATAVTATGIARELTGAGDRARAAADFVTKHPQLADFVASPGCALVRVDLDILYVVTRFESVAVLHVAR